jgi:putative ABC transport system permease protein
MHRRTPLDRLDQEIQDHLEIETRDNLDRGMDPVEARRAARLAFGNVAMVKQEAYNVWHPVWLQQLLQDTKYALRSLLRNRRFAGTVIFTLALAIGMNTAVFSVVEAVLIRPLPYPEANRLVWLAAFDRDYQAENDNHIERADYTAWRTQTRAFDRTAAYGNQDLALMIHGEPYQERVLSLTGDLWNLTGAEPELGRLFHSGETHAMVISDSVYERAFHRNPAVLGQVVTVNDFPFTIVGVLRKSFRFVLPQQAFHGDEVRDIAVYIPIPTAMLTSPPMGSQAWGELTKQVGPAPTSLDVLGRLRPEVTLSLARTEMDSIYKGIVQQHSPDRHVYDVFTGWRMSLLQEKLEGGARRALVVLSAAVVFVLLIGGANIANLLLARSASRKKEIAVRVAMGAGRSRVTRQFLSESLLLSVFGGVLGVLLAKAALTLMIRTWPQAIPRLTEARLDAPVLLLSIVLSCLTGLIFGFVPAVLLWGRDLYAALKDNPQTASGGKHRTQLRKILISVEIALAIVLLTGAGLMLKSFSRMSANAPGFKPESILTMRVSLAGKQYATWIPQESYIQTALDRLEVFPGVEASGIDSETLNTTVKVQGLVSGTSEGTFSAVRAVSLGYLRAMGVPLVAGKWPSDNRTLDEVLVNESFARSLSQKGELLGRQVNGGFLNGRIVGVVADFKYSQMDAEPIPEVYTSYQLAPLRSPMTVHFFVRVGGTSAPDANALRRVVASLDPTQPVYAVQTLQQSLSDSIAPRRFNLFLLGTFAAVALLMALVGIYGVIAYSVAERAQEIGIRMAVGADRGHIIGMVLLEGAKTTLFGVGTGLVAAFGLTRLMSSLLYDVKAYDPTTFLSVTLLLIGTAMLACAGPALRASLVNPVLALRSE